MSIEDKKSELLELAEAWYNGEDFDPVSDLDFDKKELEILQEDPNWDYRQHLKSQGKDIIHYLPMGKVDKMQETEKSMEEVYTEMNLDPESENSPKYDGGGLCLYYNKGVLYDALTRSSQVSGKRQLSKIVSMVPNVIEDEDIVAIECEALCSLDKGHGDLSRQAATGLLNSNSLQERCESEVTIVAFKVRYKEGVEKDWVQGTKNLPVMKSGDNITFMPTPFNEGVYSGNKFTYNGLKFLIDGIVEYKGGKSLAHKLYFNEKKISRIKKIEWNHTESSLKYVPKYIYGTVNVDGTDCSRATGGGTSQLKKMKCGVGSEVEIIKAGLTIPQVLRPTSNSVKYEYNLTPYFKGGINSDHYGMVKEIKRIKFEVLNSSTSEINNFIDQNSYLLSLDLKKANKLSIDDLAKEKASSIFSQLESYLSKLSKMNTSEDYSLPFKCECTKELDSKGKPLWEGEINWSCELNGGLYCRNPRCSVNLNVLNGYLSESGMDLESVISSDPIKFIEKYLKVPRFGGISKMKTTNGLTINGLCNELISKNSSPLEVISKYFHLSGLQLEILQILDPLMTNFISMNTGE